MSACRDASWTALPGWEERLSRATPEDMVRGLFSRHCLRAIRALGTEALTERSARASGHSRFIDFFSYPIRSYLWMMDAALPGLVERHGELERTLWLLGHCVATDFLESEAGRTMQVLVRGEAKRLVNNLPSTYQMSLTGERAVKWLGPQCCRLTMQRDFLPPSFHEGMLVAMLERMSARRIRVVGRQVDVLDSEYDMYWQ